MLAVIVESVTWPYIVLFNMYVYPRSWTVMHCIVVCAAILCRLERHFYSRI